MYWPDLRVGNILTMSIVLLSPEQGVLQKIKPHIFKNWGLCKLGKNNQIFPKGFTDSAATANKNAARQCYTKQYKLPVLMEAIAPSLRLILVI